MRGDILILIEMLVVFGLVFGFGFWQLRSLKKEREADARKAAETEAATDAATEAARDDDTAGTSTDR
jgi:cytochrome oxidase assembly protein ShyY1